MTNPKPLSPILLTSSELKELFDFVTERSVLFRESFNERPYIPQKNYAEMRRIFSAPLPEKGCSPKQAVKELADMTEPGLAPMIGPRFFGWVIGASHPAGVAADWLTSAWGQNTALSAATPAAAACEEEAARWLLELIDLPRECSVGFTTGATIANFTALAAARSHMLRQQGWDVEAKGLFGAPEIRVLIGDEAHTTVYSALNFLGLGSQRVIRVPTDSMGRMKPSDFRSLMGREKKPTIVIAQAGQINTGAFDPWDDIIPLAHEHGAWVHVDGAFGLWARACPEKASLAQGCERADSWAVDGHKWLQTPYDCGFAIVRHAEAHRRAMTIAASYLPTDGDNRDPSHYVPELSRRARGFATWTMIRALGREGIAAMILRDCKLTELMADLLSREPGITVVNDVVLNQAVVRFGGPSLSTEDGDLLTRQTIDRLQSQALCFAGGGQWKGQWVMRLSMIGWATTQQDIEISAAAIIDAYRWAKSRKD